MSFGLALSGGGTKGAAHVGVLLALEEAEMIPTSIAGTSAGALVAGLYATGTSPQALKEIVLKMSKHGAFYCDADLTGILMAIPQLVFRHNIEISGLIKGNRFERFLSKYTNAKNIQDTILPTIIPAVDLNSGKTIAYTNSLANASPFDGVEWKTDIQISEAMRASMAVPVVFKPKIIDGMCLVDGGVTDVLPVDLLIAAGERNVLAVDLAGEYETPKKHNMIDISTHSLSIMSTRLKDCRSRGEKLLLNPNLPKESGLLTFEQMEECMAAGYDAVKSNLQTIKAIFA